MGKLNWGTDRARQLVYEARDQERLDRAAERRAFRLAREAREAAQRAGVRTRAPRTREETCAWLDSIMKSHPDRPWLEAERQESCRRTLGH